MCTGGSEPALPGHLGAPIDIIAYAGVPSVKVGREFLLKFVKKKK